MRSQRLELRLTPQERATDEAAAVAVGETLSDFVRRAAADRADAVLAREQRVALSEQEAVRFLDALESTDAQTVVRLTALRRRG